MGPVKESAQFSVARYGYNKLHTRYEYGTVAATRLKCACSLVRLWVPVMPGSTVVSMAVGGYCSGTVDTAKSTADTLLEGGCDSEAATCGGRLLILDCSAAGGSISCKIEIGLASRERQIHRALSSSDDSKNHIRSE